MTRKDFILISDALRITRPLDTDHATAWRQWRDDCKGVAYALAATNARFDKARFIAACEQVLS